MEEKSQDFAKLLVDLPTRGSSAPRPPGAGRTTARLQRSCVPALGVCVGGLRETGGVSAAG